MYSEKIKWSLVGGKQCCELYSTYLILKLRSIADGFNWKDGHCYHIEGRLIEAEKLVTFCMADSILLEENIEE